MDITFEETILPSDENELAEFSSRGPGPDFEIKPEVTAPGVDIYSAVPGGEWAPLSGTSMSSPHVAGAAALVLGLEPDWMGLNDESGVMNVRSALVNTAAPVVEVNAGADGPMGRGNGLVQVGDAVNTAVLADPATVSFGRLASQGPAFRTTAQRDVVIKNTSDNSVELTVSIDGQSAADPDVVVSDGVQADVELNVTLDEEVTLTLTADGSGQANGTYWGRVELDDGNENVKSLPFWYRVGR